MLVERSNSNVDLIAFFLSLISRKSQPTIKRTQNILEWNHISLGDGCKKIKISMIILYLV